MSTEVHTYVNQKSVIAISVLFPVLATAAVTGRICARRRKNLRFGIDDYLCFAATVILTGCSVDLIVGAAIRTVGFHSIPSSKNFDIPHIIQLEKVEWSYNQLWFLGITLVKLSWLFSFWKIFRGKVFQITNYSAIVLALSWGICFSLVNFFACGRHIDLNWNPVPQFYDPKCVNLLEAYFANALVSCLLDVIIVVIPMPVVYQLNLPMKSRLALMGLFAIGAFCVAASAVRLALYSSLWWAVRVNDEQFPILGLRGADDFGIVSLALFWSHIEFGVALIACCLPSLRVLMTQSELFRSIHSTISSTILQRRRASKSNLPSDCSSEEAQIETKPNFSAKNTNTEIFEH